MATTNLLLLVLLSGAKTSYSMVPANSGSASLKTRRSPSPAAASTLRGSTITDASYALGAESPATPSNNVLLAQSSVDVWNENLGRAWRRWTPMVVQWTSYGAIAGAGAGACALFGYPALAKL